MDEIEALDRGMFYLRIERCPPKQIHLLWTLKPDRAAPTVNFTTPNHGRKEECVQVIRSPKLYFSFLM